MAEETEEKQKVQPTPAGMVGFYDMGADLKEQGLELVDVTPEGDPIVVDPSNDFVKFTISSSEILNAAQEKGIYQPGDEVDYNTPDNPVNYSPMGPIERAWFGHAGKRSVKAQEEYLQKEFGKNNVKRRRDKEGDLSFSVRKGDKGKVWYNADPEHSWKKTLTGGAFDEASGEVFQYIGAHGSKTVGALAVVAAVGSGVGIIPAAIASGVGAVTGESTELGAELLLGNDISPEEMHQRLTGAAIFGATQEFGGRAASKVIGKTIEFTAKTLSVLKNSNSVVARKMFKMLSRQDDALVLARIDDIPKTARFDQIAREDAFRGFRQDRLLNANQDAVKQLVDDASDAMVNVQKQYGELAEKFRKGTKGKFESAPSDFVKRLNEKGMMTEKFELNPAKPGEPGIRLKGADKEAMNEALVSMRNIRARGNKITYDELIREQSNVNSLLYKRTGKSELSDSVWSDIQLLSKDIQDVLNKGIAAANDPALIVEKQALDKLYEPSKKLLNEFRKASNKEAKYDLFLNRIKKADGSFNSEAATSLSNLLKVKDPTGDILRRESARQAVPLFGSRGTIPTSPRAATAIVKAGAGLKKAARESISLGPVGVGIKRKIGDAPIVKQGAEGVRKLDEALTAKVIPFMHKTVQQLNKMDPGFKKALLGGSQGAEVLNAIQLNSIDAALLEESTTRQLVEEGTAVGNEPNGQ